MRLCRMPWCEERILLLGQWIWRVVQKQTVAKQASFERVMWEKVVWWIWYVERKKKKHWNGECCYCLWHDHPVHISDIYLLPLPHTHQSQVTNRKALAYTRSDFLGEYITTRNTLKVIFHLIEGRLTKTIKSWRRFRKRSQRVWNMWLFWRKRSKIWKGQALPMLERYRIQGCAGKSYAGHSEQ